MLISLCLCWPRVYILLLSTLFEIRQADCKPLASDNDFTLNLKFNSQTHEGQILKESRTYAYDKK